MSQQAYTALIVLVALERLAELLVSSRNLTWARDHGGTEAGQSHYPAMVVLHIGLLVGCLAEVWWADPDPSALLSATMLVLVLAAQALRWWCIASLGRRWNTRVVVVPGMPLVRTGPYRYLRHPNYVAVVVEGIALPLVGGAWLTAVVFTVLNAWLLRVRIGVEDRALATSAP